jgi:hypothetical protein
MAIYAAVTTSTRVHLFASPENSMIALAQSNTHFTMYTRKDTPKGDMNSAASVNSQCDAGRTITCGNACTGSSTVWELAYRNRNTCCDSETTSTRISIPAHNIKILPDCVSSSTLKAYHAQCNGRSTTAAVICDVCVHC